MTRSTWAYDQVVVGTVKSEITAVSAVGAQFGGLVRVIKRI